MFLYGKVEEINITSPKKQFNCIFSSNTDNF